jgi:hypothetical protein
VISDSRYEKIGLGNPRLGSAVQVLTDIALLQSDENDVFHVTEEGLDLLESELERGGEA